MRSATSALSGVREEAATAVVTELASGSEPDFVGVYRLVGEDRLEPLATWNASEGLLVGGPPLSMSRGR